MNLSTQISSTLALHRQVNFVCTMTHCRRAKPMHRMFRQAYNKQKLLANWEECHMLNFSRILWKYFHWKQKIWSCTVQKWKYIQVQ